MKEFKGTPGPWYVEDGDLGNETLIVLSDNFPFKMMSKENRDLITAAPELLEALRQLRDYVEDMHAAKYGGDWVDESHPMSLARSAIAKALGE